MFGGDLSGIYSKLPVKVNMLHVKKLQIKIHPRSELCTCSFVIVACVTSSIGLFVLVVNNEIARSPADAVSTAPTQWVNPLTKEQLQQAFIYLLQVLWIHILLTSFFSDMDILFVVFGNLLLKDSSVLVVVFVSV